MSDIDVGRFDTVSTETTAAGLRQVAVSLQMLEQVGKLEWYRDADIRDIERFGAD
jgi:hypothetical protein